MHRPLLLISVTRFSPWPPPTAFRPVLRFPNFQGRATSLHARQAPFKVQSSKFKVQSFPPKSSVLRPTVLRVPSVFHPWLKNSSGLILTTLDPIRVILVIRGSNGFPVFSISAFNFPFPEVPWFAFPFSKVGRRHSVRAVPPISAFQLAVFLLVFRHEHAR